MEAITETWSRRLTCNRSDARTAFFVRSALVRSADEYAVSSAVSTQCFSSTRYAMLSARDLRLKSRPEMTLVADFTEGAKSASFRGLRRF
jgi:hypothetical protein